MKIIFTILLGLALCGCASPKGPPLNGGVETPADTAKARYWQLQQPPSNADEAPHYRRLTIVIPAHTEGGVSYETQTRTILIAE